MSVSSVFEIAVFHDSLLRSVMVTHNLSGCDHAPKKDFRVYSKRKFDMPLKNKEYLHLPNLKVELKDNELKEGVRKHNISL